MTKKLFIISLAVAALSVIAQTGASSAETMTADQIKKEILGRSLNYSGAFSGKITYHNNGSISYTAKGKKFTGQWRFKQNKFCTNLSSRIRNQTWNCFTFSKKSDGRYRTSLGYKVWR
ncbi:hypothetical protein [Breoghania sp. L-A4]|uniref:hypothetical protein n=1 Tax=Breoghania sp. L-A4 TaxID=2304600 RepID=UPI0013C2A203|nr:hypothetical protein [Breoghania sp. L-A4]